MKARFKVLFISIPILVALLVTQSWYNKYIAEDIQIAHIPQPVLSSSHVTSAASPTATGQKSQSTRPQAFASSNPDSSAGASTALSYRDSKVAISITKQRIVYGAGTSVMYVADIRLSDISCLYTAFAKDEYGRNITQTVSSMAQNNHAVLAINGDYYGFRDDGIIVRNGVLYRSRPARDMLAIFKNGAMSTFHENSVDITKMLAGGLVDTFSFGPVLVSNGRAASQYPKMTSDIDIHFQNNNPRTGIGFFSPNHFAFVVVDGRSKRYSAGITLPEFAQQFVKLGCKEAYNLDGGGSTTMYFNGKVINDPLGRNGVYQRRVSDAICIEP